MKTKIWLIVLLAVVSLGIIAGCFSSSKMTDDEKAGLSHTIEENAKEELSAFGILKKSIAENSAWILIIWCLGLTVFGRVAIPLLMCCKGYFFGITIGYIFSKYGGKGFLVNLLCVLPHYTLFLAAAVFLALVGVSYYGKNQRYEKRDFLTYALCGGAAEAATLLASFIEAYSSAKLFFFLNK